MFSLLELFFSCCRVVAVAKENLLETPAIISFANFQRIQILRCPRLAFDWLSVSFFYYWPIRMSGLLLLLLCTELTLLCTELPEIYLNQPELNNFFIYIIRNSNEAPPWSWGKIEELKKFPHNQVVNKNKFSPFPPLSLSPISPSLPPISPSLSPPLSPLSFPLSSPSVSHPSLPPLSPTLSLPPRSPPLSLPPLS